MANLPTGLEGKVVLITGASSGLGRALSLEFAKQGAQLAITGRDLNELYKTKQLAHEVSRLKEDQDFLDTADLSIAEECQKVVAKVVEKLGKLDVLVNNAGFLLPGSLETQTVEQFDSQINLNTRAAFVLTQAALPHLKQTKGNVVNISSVGGAMTVTGIFGYSTSKAALNHLTKCMALDLAFYGVRCNAVSPTVIDTPFVKKFCGSEEYAQGILEQQKAIHPLGQIGNVKDVAKAVLFLASNELSGLITGTNLVIDGGSSLLTVQQPKPM